jgi:hypothetical protein
VAQRATEAVEAVLRIGPVAAEQAADRAQQPGEGRGAAQPVEGDVVQPDITARAARGDDAIHDAAFVRR